ncbi:hypothetical protein C8Q72DRAFT_901193 [Fomitopsis betulina]|nr:hypothetical protein C8Q72DRAFT_901193 [Fomitopsis betulina]
MQAPEPWEPWRGRVPVALFALAPARLPPADLPPRAALCGVLVTGVGFILACMGRMLTPGASACILRAQAVRARLAAPASLSEGASKGRALEMAGGAGWSTHLASPYQPTRDPHARPPSHTCAQLLCNSRPVIPSPPFLPLPLYMGLAMHGRRLLASACWDACSCTYPPTFMPTAQFADLHSLLPSPRPLVPLPLCTLVSVSARPTTCLLCRRANITVPALSSRSALVHSYLPLPASSLSCPPVAAPAHAFASAPTFVCPPSRTCPTACDRTCPPPPWCSPSHLRARLCLDPAPLFVPALSAFAYLLAHRHVRLPSVVASHSRGPVAPFSPPIAIPAPATARLLTTLLRAAATVTGDPRHCYRKANQAADRPEGLEGLEN